MSEALNTLTKNQQTVLDILESAKEPLKAYAILFDTQKKGKDGYYEINDRARILWESLLPSLNFERRFGVNAYKWVFWKRGIIKSPTTRLPVRKPFDLADQEELQRIMDRLSPLMT